MHKKKKDFCLSPSGAPAGQPIVAADRRDASAIHPAAPRMNSAAGSPARTDQPGHIVANFRSPVAQSTRAVAKSSHPVSQPARLVAKSGPPVSKPAHPVAQSAHPVSKPVHPVAQSPRPVVKSAHLVAKSSHPVAKFWRDGFPSAPLLA